MTISRFASVVLAACSFIACAVDSDPDPASSSTTSEVGGTPHFDLWQDGGSHQYYFHLRAGNGQVLVVSEGYSSRTDALGGLLSVLDNGGNPGRYAMLVAANHQSYFVLEAANDDVIATSETYSSSSAAKAGITATETAVGAYLQHWETATGARFDVFEGSDGRYYFDLHAANDQIVLQSQGYSSKAAALNGTFSVEDNGLASASYRVSPASGGGYYFDLVATNGQVIGTSQVYASQYDAERGRDAVIALLPQVQLL
ncbi:MAG TPA: DUF1508 domain-containing protein [Kofleriaceae bacterium]|nr:DUF1508 domain-containing protein [Kofleriaceae bacterium]